MNKSTYDIVLVSLLAIVCVLLGVITWAVAFRGSVRVPNAPRSKITDLEWERAKRDALASPPIEWATYATDPADQLNDFNEWQWSTPFLVPEVRETVRPFLQSSEPVLDVVVTNHTGAQYRITGLHDSNGARCSVKFIGNINW